MQVETWSCEVCWLSVAILDDSCSFGAVWLHLAATGRNLVLTSEFRAWDMCNPARRARRLRSTGSCRIFSLIIILNQKQRCRSKLDHKYPLRRRKTSQRSATIATYAQRLLRPSSKRGITSVLTASSPAFRSAADLGVKSVRLGRRPTKVSFAHVSARC